MWIKDSSFFCRYNPINKPLILDDQVQIEKGEQIFSLEIYFCSLKHIFCSNTFDYFLSDEKIFSYIDQNETKNMLNMLIVLAILSLDMLIAVTLIKK